MTQKNEEKKVNNERKYEKIFPREEEPFDNVSVKVFFVHNVTKDYFFSFIYSRIYVRNVDYSFCNCDTVMRVQVCTRVNG